MARSSSMFYKVSSFWRHCESCGGVRGQEAMAVGEGRDNQSLDEGSGNGEEEGERVQRST